MTDKIIEYEENTTIVKVIKPDSDTQIVDNVHKNICPKILSKFSLILAT